MVKINSAIGNNFGASVNNLNKLETRSIDESIEALHARGGLKYNIVTGIINIDDSDDNAVLYFKNNEEEDFVITAYGMMLGTSTGGSGGEWRFRSIRNPTAGTLVSGGTDVTPVNFNAGSAKTLSSTVKKMASANQTLTDGDDPWLATTGTGTGLNIVTVGALILPQGTSMGIVFNDQPSNTSRNVEAFILGYRNSLITTDVVNA